MTRISRGKAEIDIELYDQFRTMEAEFKKHSIVEWNPYFDQFMTFYSRDAFNKKQFKKIEALEKERDDLKKDNKQLACSLQEACDELQKYKAIPSGLIVEKPNVKTLSIFQFIKLKLRG